MLPGAMPILHWFLDNGNVQRLFSNMGRPQGLTLFAFLTPFGRVKYCRLRMGYTDSSDQFSIATKTWSTGVNSTTKIMDDIPREPETLSETLNQLTKLCTRATEIGVQFFTMKFKTGVSAVFSGFHLSTNLRKDVKSVQRRTRLRKL